MCSRTIAKVAEDRQKNARAKLWTSVPYLYTVVQTCRLSKGRSSLLSAMHPSPMQETCLYFQMMIKLVSVCAWRQASTATGKRWFGFRRSKNGWRAATWAKAHHLDQNWQIVWQSLVSRRNALIAGPRFHTILRNIAVYEVELQKQNCNPENMLGALSLLANSGADSCNAGMVSDIDGFRLQGPNLSS